MSAYGRDIHAAMAKLGDQNKQLQKQVERLSQEIGSNKEKHELTETNLNKRIEGLSD
jgi:hypothetical protein